MKKIIPFILVISTLYGCSSGVKRSDETELADEKQPTEQKTEKPTIKHLVVVKSELSGKEVVERLKAGLLERKLMLFNDIAHHEGAKTSGKDLPFTQLIIFGNPELGTRLMQCDQRMGLELPLKLLVTTNKKGVTHISYTNPNYYRTNYHVGKCSKVIKNMVSMLKKLANEAANKPTS